MESLQSFNFVSRYFHLLVFAVYFSHLLGYCVSQTRSDLTKGSTYFFYQHPQYPKDCQEILSQCSATKTVTSVVHLIKPDGYPQPFEVSCDNRNVSGGWTVIQRRFDGSIDFGRSWEEYKDGFGFPSSEFWLGTEKLSYLTNQKTYELQIDMVNAAGLPFSVHYDQFRISDEWGEFKLASFGEYSGNATSPITYCPTNMEYDTCFCQSTCSGDCEKNCVDGEETCICPNGFFLDQDSNCVLQQECGCYQEEFGVISEGETQVTSDCSRRCSCNNNQVSCVNIACSADATCQEISGAYQCQCNDGFEGDGLSCTRRADCFDLYNAGNTADGIYTINPSGETGSEFQVYCDMTTAGGGWTVFQSRQGRSESFYRNWVTYKAGFGAPSGEHWLGNDKLHTMTSLKNYQLRVDLVDSGGSSYHALYNSFNIGNENNNYRLSLGTYSGTAGNSLSSNRPFSTHDRDNDPSSSYNCAEKHRSGWWYANYDETSNNQCYVWYRSRSRTCDSCCSYYYYYYCGYYYCYYYYYYCYYYYYYCGYYCYYSRSQCCERHYSYNYYYARCTNSNLNGDFSGGNGQNIFWRNGPGNDCNIQHTEMKIRPVNLFCVVSD